MKICFLDNNLIPYTSKDITSEKLRGAENILINLYIMITNFKSLKEVKLINF